MEPDVLVVGSGPAGAHAAKQAITDGLSVTMIDFGVDEPQLADSIPQLPFSTLRRSDPNQRDYLLGKTFAAELTRNDRPGAHFTAPREYITKYVNEFLPIESATFRPVQSLALGGLGAGWGAVSMTYEPFELERAGLPPAEMSLYYDDVIRDIGVSGETADDAAPYVLRTKFAQRASEMDTNAQSILDLYHRLRPKLHSKNFRLGRDPLAMLTEELSLPGVSRTPNPYTDMDYYGTSNYSVYRPKYTIVELQQNRKFQYLPGALVRCFQETTDGIIVTFSDQRSGEVRTIAAKKLLLAAGPLNSARIALSSYGMYNTNQPLLSNPMHYLPCVNLSMLGRPAKDRRHSLGQLVSVYTPQHRAPDHVIADLISYRSLLHYRILQQMPLPPSLGLIVSRTLMTCFTMFGLHHPDAHSRKKWIALQKSGSTDLLIADYQLSSEEKALISADIRGFLRCIRRLRCIPLAIIAAPHGGSIHYAGTIPIAEKTSNAPLGCDQNGKLIGSNHVFLADAASWRFLPAKAPTLTIMANARRVAHQCGVNLRAERSC
jgi:hypothetical protein